MLTFCLFYCLCSDLERYQCGQMERLEHFMNKKPLTCMKDNIVGKYEIETQLW